MRYRVSLRDEAKVQLRDLSPVPRRLARRALRDMAQDPYSRGTIPLGPPADNLYRVRVGDYRIIFEPGPGHREIAVLRIGHRESVYEGLGCSDSYRRFGSGVRPTLRSGASVSQRRHRYRWLLGQKRV